MNLNLKKKRQSQNLTQVQISKIVNVSERAYQDYEAGKRVPNVYTAQLIAQALQTKVEDIFPLPQRQLTGEEKPDGNQA